MIATPSCNASIAIGLGALARSCRQLPWSRNLAPAHGRYSRSCGAAEQPHPEAPLEVDRDQRIDVVQAGFGVTGRRGRVFETITPDAMKGATDICETNPTWNGRIRSRVRLVGARSL
jgi:hypothetical protein